MAGTAFFSGMAPGLASMMGKMTDQTLEAKGYKYGADARKSHYDAGKAQAETEDLIGARSGRIAAVAGQHGMDPNVVRDVWGRLQRGEALDPHTTGLDDAGRAKFNLMMRDLGAYQTGKPTDISSYQGAMAEVPGKQAASQASVSAMDLIKQAQTNPAMAPQLNEQLNRLGNVRTGAQITQGASAPGEVQMWEAYKMADPATKKMMETFFGNRRQADAPFVGMGNGAMGNKFTGQVTGGMPSIDQMIAEIWREGQKNKGGPAPAPGGGAAKKPSKSGEW